MTVDAFDVIRQRTVPATKVDKPKKATRDVFEVAKRVADLTDVKIERNVPLPKLGRENVYRKLLSKMNSGDMVRLPTWQANVLYSQAYRAGVKVRRHRLDDETTGIWKV